MNPWESEYKTQQGNIGLGRAIAYYTSRGIPVMLPLNDAQKYDLVIDEGSLKRVSVKTTRSKNNNGKFIVQLKNTTLGANHNTIRRFNREDSDVLFIVTRDFNMYEIPTCEVNSTCNLTLSDYYDRYKVTL